MPALPPLHYQGAEGSSIGMLLLLEYRPVPRTRLATLLFPNDYRALQDAAGRFIRRQQTHGTREIFSRSVYCSSANDLGNDHFPACNLPVT